MAGRFANLEFNDEHHGHLESSETLGSTERTASDLLADADDEYRWGRFETALRLYTRSLHEDRTAIPAWVGQVQMLVRLDECHEARVWSDKALELFRSNGELLAAKAQACTRLSDFKVGLACSDASLQAAGSSPWRWIVRGETLLAKGQKHHEECFERALTEPASDWFDRIVIASIYRFYDRVTNALCYVQQALEVEPGRGYIWYEMGNCQVALGLGTAAQTSYRRCLELRADYAEAERAMTDLSAGRSLSARIRGVWRRWRRR